MRVSGLNSELSGSDGEQSGLVWSDSNINSDNSESDNNANSNNNESDTTFKSALCTNMLPFWL